MSALKSDVKRSGMTSMNLKVSKEVFYQFKDYCKEIGCPMNVILETFMVQYSNGKLLLTEEEIQKWKSKELELETINTTFDKEIYTQFKSCCKGNGYFVKHVITALMVRFNSRKYRIELVEVDHVSE